MHLRNIRNRSLARRRRVPAVILALITLDCTRAGFDPSLSSDGEVHQDASAPDILTDSGTDLMRHDVDGADDAGASVDQGVPPLLRMTPSRLVLDVAGPCQHPCPILGASKRLTLTNDDSSPTRLLATRRSGDSANFRILSDTCSGKSLAPQATCEMTLAARAGENGDHRGEIIVEDGDGRRGSASLSGSAVAFSCTVGAPGPGGYYTRCGSDFDSIAMPGGCSGTTGEPICPNTSDGTGVEFIWAPVDIHADTSAQSVSDGTKNSANILALAQVLGPEAFPAVQYCAQMVYRGFDDWYLPAVDELTALERFQTSIGMGPSPKVYWSSTSTGAISVGGLVADSVTVLGGVSSRRNTTVSRSAHGVRCLRRTRAADTPASVSYSRPAGYLVLSQQSWTGNLGGSAGANALCLSDLQTNEWLGKEDALTRNLLRSQNVTALLCEAAACQNLPANTRYHFAHAGQPTIGGAILVSDRDGAGIARSINWSGATYFGSERHYWSGPRRLSDMRVNNGSMPTSVSNACRDWASESATDLALVGYSAIHNAKRITDRAETCDQRAHLLCLVQP